MVFFKSRKLKLDPPDCFKIQSSCSVEGDCILYLPCESHFVSIL